MSLPLLPAKRLTPAERERLRTKVMLQLDSAPVRPHRARRFAFVGIGAAVVLGAGGTAVAYQVLGSAAPTDDTSARCYSALSNDFGADFPGATVGSPPASDGSGGQVVAPVALCTQIWSQLGPGLGADPRNVDPPYTVPHMVGCVLPNGTAAVFPGPAGSCQQLDLKSAIGG